MQLYSMADILVEIYNIRNIESIKIYDLVLSKVPKLMIIPSLLISYDGGKILNLCSKDKFFNTYIKKVVQVYNDEKNNILEDILTDPFKMRTKIEIDSHSKEIMESGILENINEIYKFYDNKSYYEGSLLFQKVEVKLLIPILKYHIQKLFSNTDKIINFDDLITGYRNNYIISGSLNGIPTKVLLTYDKISDNEYLFNIGGLLDKNSPIIMKIKFNNDKIDVNIDINLYNVTSNFVYLISNEMVKSINDIKKDGAVIYYENIDLNEVNNELLNIANIDRESNFKWFMLPWDAYYGINSNIIDLCDTEKNIEISNMYLYSNKDSFMRKEYFSKSYKRNNSALVNGESICLDQVIKNTFGVCLSNLDNIYLIETAFLDTVHVSGYYDEKLKNKYFYHLVESKNGIKEIEGKKLISISKENDILEKGDTLNNELVLKLVRGK